MSVLCDQEISLKILSRVVSWLVILLSLRWSSSLYRAQIFPIMQSIVVQGALGRIESIDFNTKYKDLKATIVSDFHLLQLQQTQNKTVNSHNSVKYHCDKIQELVIMLSLFKETSALMIDTIKCIKSQCFFK